jgi:bifunctional DNase/RNase
MSELFEVSIKGLTLDPLTNMPIVILKDIQGKRALPIWIGVFEANAIALEMEKIETPRPMTHDLIVNMLKTLNIKVSRVVVSDLRENTFFATIFVDQDGVELNIDARPSDAIALAIRTSVPIFVTKEVMEKSQSIEMGDEFYDEQKLKSWLENLKPEDFGKFPM